MKRILVSLAALTLFTAVALPASADVLYSQRTADPNLGGRWQSETSNSNLGFTQALDNFTLASDGTITTVSWTGLLKPDFTPVNGFTISIYADGFQPGDASVGQPLSTTVINGDAGQSPDPTTPTVGQFGVFEFSTAINPFQATGGTQYWISIVGDPSKNSGDVYWAFSDQGDGSFDSFDGSAVEAVGADLAFTLSNTTVPEPSGLVLDGSGLLVLAGFGRRLLAQKLSK